ncbi:MAG: hypothetical protein, partial [Olavius algarvensis Gamma 3 endosymbiont]
WSAISMHIEVATESSRSASSCRLLRRPIMST